MRIPTWRLALTGGAVVVLAVAGIGFAAASSAPAAPAANVPAAESTAAPNAAAGPITGLWNRLGAGRLLRIGRQLVHADVTVNRGGQLVNLELDHGTVQSIGGGKLTIAEAGGTTVTVSTDDATKVHLGRTAGKLTDVKVGAEVFVRSLVDGGNALAKGILVVPAAAT